MKKLLFLIAILYTICIFSSCSVTQSPISEYSSSSEQQVSTVDSSIEGLPTIDNEILVKQMGLTITSQNLVYDPVNGWALSILIENDTEHSLFIQCSTLAVNHFKIPNASDCLLCTIDSGKTSTETIYLNSNEWEAVGLDIPTDIEINFSVMSTEINSITGEVYSENFFTSNEYMLKTSMYEIITQKPELKNGVSIFEEEGIQVIVRAEKTNDNYRPYFLIMFIENNTDSDILVATNNLVINNHSDISLLQATASPGYCAISYDYITQDELASYHTSNISNLQMDFTIFDHYNSKDIELEQLESIAHTDLINIPISE